MLSIELIIISMLSTLDGARKKFIPDSKLIPRSIYDVLTPISNDFQQSLCQVWCRHGVKSALVIITIYRYFFFLKTIAKKPGLVKFETFII